MTEKNERNLKAVSGKVPADAVVLIVILLLYCVNSFWMKDRIGGWVGYFLRCHFNDLCAGVFFIAYLNIVLKRKGILIRKLIHILLTCFAAGIVWEFFAPVINPRSTADLIDLICYMAGGLIYWILQQIAWTN